MTGYFSRNKSQLRPRTLQKIILYIIIISMGTSLVASNVIVSLLLKHYSNPKHKDIHGDCCDLVCHVGFLRSCENQITLCIADIESASLPVDTFFSSSASDHCPYFHRVIYHHNGDNFDFTPVLRYGIPNPIPINIIDYKGGFLIVMKIVDDDDGSEDDIVDYYKQNISITPSKSVYSASAHSYTLSGPGYSQTTIEVKVYCDVNFYGTTCSVKCVAFDTDDDGHYTCDSSTGDKVCLPGFNGTLCKIEINECESSPCQNGGSCRDHRNYFTCECAEGTSGERCEINADECASEPCQHRSSCVDEINGYQCQCVDGYTGPTCSVDVDECASAPCENNATCVDQFNNYTCECQPGYDGSQCDFSIGACASGPCENNATCLDLMDSFSCECVGGFEGEFCQTEIDECQSNPCYNSGSCLDMINLFQCNCTTGYSGLLCESDHDNCASGPCSNGATCTDVLNGYVCSCSSGFFGVQCKGSVLLTTLLIAAVVLLLIILLIATLTLFRRHNCIPRRGHGLILNIAYINEDD